MCSSLKQKWSQCKRCIFDNLNSYTQGQGVTLSNNNTWTKCICN